MKRIIVSILFSFIIFKAVAIPPVTVVVTMTPPYTPYLNEYGSMSTSRLRVTLIVNDGAMQSYPVKLQMVLEPASGNSVLMQTSPYAAIPPVLLQGNSSEILEGADLAPYFRAQNITFIGIDQGQYIQTGRIPDGQYRIGFRVVDSRRTDVVLSNTAYSAPGWFVLNDPPLLNLPRNTETAKITDPQNVMLEWFPRHLGSMNSAFATRYKVELFAIRVPGMNPEQVALASLPTFTYETTRPRLYLTQAEYMLEPGIQYAWRVKAYADEDITVFNNNGYSEVFSFIYGTACPTPMNPQADVLGPEKVNINYDTDPLQTSFQVRYRVNGQSDAVWHYSESYQNMISLASLLSPQTKYEYQVMAKCNESPSDYSRLLFFTTPGRVSTYQCGAKDSNNITNHNPKAALNVGDFIYNGKFPLKLTEVSGGSGTFTGKGRMRIPMLNNIQVNMKFTGIKVNELNQIYDGELVSIYDVDSKFLVDIQTSKEPVLNRSQTLNLQQTSEKSLSSKEDTIINKTQQDQIVQKDEIILDKDGKGVIGGTSNDNITNGVANLATNDAIKNENNSVSNPETATNLPPSNVNLIKSITFSKIIDQYIPIKNDIITVTVQLDHPPASWEKYTLSLKHLKRLDLDVKDNAKDIVDFTIDKDVLSFQFLVKSNYSYTNFELSLKDEKSTLDKKNYQLPIDSDNDEIADAWELKPENGGTLSLGGNKNDASWDDETSKGNSNNGDNITKIDEYRGIELNGKYLRLKPTRKEIFLNTSSTAYGAMITNEIQNQLDVDVIEIGHLPSFLLCGYRVVMGDNIFDATVASPATNGLLIQNGISTGNNQITFGACTGSLGEAKVEIYIEAFKNVYMNNSIAESETTQFVFPIACSSGLINYIATYNGVDLNGNGTIKDLINPFDLLAPPRATGNNVVADNDPIDGLIVGISFTEAVERNIIHEVGHSVGMGHTSTGDSPMRSSIGPAHNRTYTPDDIKQMILK